MYSKNVKRMWALSRPGCLILLVDQSPAGHELVCDNTFHGALRKSELVANHANTTLSEVQKRCSVGTVVRPRVDVAVLGYGPGGSVQSVLGGNLANQDLVSITDLAANPLRINHVMVSEYNPNTGTIDQVPQDVPIWVEPAVGDSSPMCAALEVANYIAHRWARNHMNSFPPIVLNITSGECSDGDPLPHAKRLTEVITDDGATLLFNCCIASTRLPAIRYPRSIRQVGYRRRTMQLFMMSSVIPEAMLDRANVYHLMDLPPGTRGFVSGDEFRLMNFLQLDSQVVPERNVH